MKNILTLLFVLVCCMVTVSTFAQQNHGFHGTAQPPLIKIVGLVPATTAHQRQPAQQNEDEENEDLPGRRNNPASPAVSSYQSSNTNTPAGTLGVGNLTVLSNFLSTTISEGAGYFPPDCNGDISTFSQMMLAVNGKLKVYNIPSATGTALTTTQLSSPTSLAAPVLYMNIDSFFTNGSLGITKITDPHVRFDRFSKRWFIIAQDNTATHTANNYICVAVSNAASALTTASTFSVYYILSTTNDPTAATDWFDYPTLGIDKYALYVSGNILDKTTRNNLGSTLFVIRKDLLLTGTASFTVWPHGTGAGTSGSNGSVGMLTAQAVHNDDPSATEGFFISTGWTFGQLLIKRVSNPGTSTPTLSADITLTVPITTVPINQPALGTTGNLNPFDDRLFGAMAMKNKITGVVSLWTAHNIEVNTSGVGTAGGGRNGARWYEITNLASTPTLNQSGTIFDATVTSPRGFIDPTIAMNGQGHALLGGTTASSKCRTQAMIASRYFSDPLGTLQPFDTLTKVTQAYNPTTALQRWGDYSQTIVDPTDNMTMWTFQEYCNATNSWGVRAIQVKAPPPAQSVTVSGTPACFSGPAVSITLTGLATNNAGFFDPGPGYNPLTVTCSGSIAVSNIVFVSPTQITCTINSAVVAAGIYTFTITNPDGQTVTANFTITTSLATHYFRTRQNGNWNNINTWESSPVSDFSSGLISPATLSPDVNAGKISIQSTDSVTVTSNVTIDHTFINSGGMLSVTGSTLTVVNNGLTVQSSALYTGSIGNSTGTISGNVIVERYIPDDGHRAWRLLSVPTTGQTIRQAWQENGAAVSNLGTLITSNTYTDGFDLPASNNSSILMHTQGGLSGASWSARPVTSTNVAIANEQGYMLYVRGDRTATAANSIHPFTTLRTTGTLKQGTQPAVSISSVGSGYTLIGNPFASPIDFEQFAGTTNLDQNFAIWDANLAGAHGLGGYRTVERTGPGTYQQTPALAGGTIQDNSMRYIHSGQAFFLHATGGTASIVLSENSKAIVTPSINPFTPVAQERQLVVNLVTMDSNNVLSLADGFRIRYDTSYLASTADDIQKGHNFSENLSSVRENKLLIVEKRPVISGADTIFINMTGTTIRDYQFQVNPVNFAQFNGVASIKDNYLQTFTTIDHTNISSYSFSITIDPASGNADRFQIIFTPLTTLPISMTSITAVQQNADVVVKWKVDNEYGVQRYEVQRSSDALNFVQFASQPPTDNNLHSVYYNSLDRRAIDGVNFYRVKSVSMNGGIAYSGIVKLFLGKGNSNISIYPNPVENRIIHVQMNNMPKGIYQLQLINSAGQVVFTRNVEHNDGSSSESLAPGRYVSKGSYVLKVTHPDMSSTKHTLIY